MNQEKIGKFIMLQRKEKGLTQQQLGDLIGVSNKSISKWERGINLPDSSLYIPLCNALDISLDEFFSGEKLQADHAFLSTEKLEAELSEIKKSPVDTLYHLYHFINQSSMHHLSMALELRIFENV